MKNILTKSLICLLVVLALIVPTSALTLNKDSSATEGMPASLYKISFAEDFSTAVLNGKNYTRVNLQDFVTTNSKAFNVEYNYTTKQQETISSVELFTGYSAITFRINVSFKDGSFYQANFIKNSYLNDYNMLIGGNQDSIKINFTYPEGNSVSTTTAELLEGDAERLAVTYSQDKYDIYSYNKDKTLCYKKGVLIVESGVYYYAEYTSEFTSEDINAYSSVYCTAYKITNQNLVVKIDDALEKYYGSDIGFLEDQDFSEKISLVMMCSIFALLPLVLLVLSLIMAIKSKTKYRKMFVVLLIACILELLVFGALVVILLI